MKVAYDPEYDQAFVGITEQDDLHHDDGMYGRDEDGTIVSLNLEHLSRGVDLRSVPRALYFSK
ncbi:MAG: hypothetical protein ACYDAG_18045 [Chloroflexota bacterium]